jgi:Fic family protein
LHYEIIALQPFEDCNKRLARAAMNLFLVLNKMPMIFFDHHEDKLGYINAFAARANGQNKVYTEYMLHATERSYRGILKNIKNSKIR